MIAPVFIIYNCCHVVVGDIKYSPDKRQQFEFAVGQGHLDSILEQGMLDMCVHEVRSIAVPSRLDYKSMIKKMHKLRQDTSLLYTVRCEGVYDRNHFHHNLLTNEFEKIDLDGDGQLSEAEVISYYRDIKNLKVPENFWEEDEDEDGVISFEEFRGPKGLTFDESDEHLSGDPENPSRLTRTIDHDLFKRARRIGHQAHGKHHRARGHATNKDEL
jgi:hypothetical protein